MLEPMPDIFSYTNYRKYLADYYNHRKSSTRGYSYRQFALKAGFSSPNTLKNVIEGTRNLTPQTSAQFANAIGLEGNRSHFFRCLVLMNQAESDLEKEKHFAKLKNYLPVKRRKELQAEAMDYIQNWIRPVIRELITTEGFREDPYWIKRRLTTDVDLEEIASTLHFLKSNGFIHKEADGTYSVKDDVVLSSDEVRSMAIRGYYRHVIEQSIHMMEKIPVSEREYGALIFNIPPEEVPELKDKLKEFLNELHRWSLEKQKHGGVVIQYLFQMYPQARSKPGTP